MQGNLEKLKRRIGPAEARVQTGPTAGKAHPPHFEGKNQHSQANCSCDCHVHRLLNALYIRPVVGDMGSGGLQKTLLRW